MTGIIGAMSVETQKLIGMMSEKQSETVSGIEFTKGRIGGRDVVVAACGVGKVFAALCTEAMILRYSPDEIINTGVGGALDMRLHICDTVIADKVCQHDMDTTALGDAPGMISGINVTYFECDERLRDALYTAAEKAKLSAKGGIVASGDLFVADSAKKDEIVRTFGASVCEMEGGAIGHVCYVNSVPFCVLRAISDGANDGSPIDFPAFCRLAADNNAEIIKEYLENA